MHEFSFVDCIGSEFNYRSEMKCPNCRVVENGEWLIPDEDVEDEEEYSLPMVNVSSIYLNRNKLLPPSRNISPIWI